jgi:hypothetical protein
MIGSNLIWIKRMALILIFWAVGLARVPSYAAIVAESNCVYFPPDIPGSFLVGVNGKFCNFDSQPGIRICFDQRCANTNLSVRFPLGAEFGRNINMFTASANLFSLLLTTRPTVAKGGSYSVFDRVKESRYIEINSNTSQNQSFGLDKYSRRQLPLTCLSELANFQTVPAIQRNPVTGNSVRPISSNCIHIDASVLPAGDFTDSISSQFSVVPTFYETDGMIDATDVTSSSKYELVANYSNLAVRVVWNASVLVYRSAVSSHYNLIFREIEDNNRPRTDLGACRVRYKKEKHENIFPHVTLSSGDASLLGFKFDDSDDKSPTCWGCTLVVSQDGHTWYEIIAVQEAVKSSNGPKTPF